MVCVGGVAMINDAKQRGCLRRAAMGEPLCATDVHFPHVPRTMSRYQRGARAPAHLRHQYAPHPRSQRGRQGGPRHEPHFDSRHEMHNDPGHASPPYGRRQGPPLRGRWNSASQRGGGRGNAGPNRTSRAPPGSSRNGRGASRDRRGPDGWVRGRGFRGGQGRGRGRGPRSGGDGGGQRRSALPQPGRDDAAAEQFSRQAPQPHRGGDSSESSTRGRHAAPHPQVHRQPLQHQQQQPHLPAAHKRPRPESASSGPGPGRAPHAAAAAVAATPPKRPRRSNAAHTAAHLHARQAPPPHQAAVGPHASSPTKYPKVSRTFRPRPGSPARKPSVLLSPSGLQRPGIMTSDITSTGAAAPGRRTTQAPHPRPRRMPVVDRSRGAPPPPPECGTGRVGTGSDHTVPRGHGILLL